MPLPRIAARISTHVAAPLMLHVSGRLPGFATLHHVGRLSGKPYRSPINVFFRGRQVVFALVYGADAQWVSNVQAAGRCTIETQGRTIELGDPQIVVDPSRQLVPWLIRVGLRFARVEGFLTMEIRDGQAGDVP